MHHNIIARMAALTAALALCTGLLAGCGRSSSSSSVALSGSSGTASSTAGSAAGSQAADSTASTTGSSAQAYAEAIVAARTEDYNGAYTVYTMENGQEGYSALSGLSGEMGEEDVQNQGQMTWELLGLNAEDVEACAFTASMMNVRSYGIAIVKPVEGHEEQVTTALQNFIESQMQAQENYLEDQYEIAKDARLETLPSGEIVLVMSEGASDLLSQLRSGLK